MSNQDIFLYNLHMTACWANIFFKFYRMGGIPAKNHRGERVLLFMGIIDILQSYR